MEKTLQRILYIEDEPDIQRVVKLALEALGGFTVDVCSSGAEAIARGPAFAPDLILLDVMMPQMDGVTTLQHLRKLPALAATPVIFMTAKVQPDEIAHFKTLGALAVIAKPFDPMALVQTVRTAWYSAAPAAPGSFAERLRALTERFHAELPERLAELQTQWAQLRRSWDANLLAEFHRGAHSLAGSGATFGLERLSLRARDVDVRLKTFLKEGAEPMPAAWAELTPLVDALMLELRLAMGAGVSVPNPAPVRAQATPQPLPIYWVGGDAAAVLAGRLRGFGYRIEQCDSDAALGAALQRSRPAAVVFDDGAGIDSGPLFARAAALRDQGIPVIMLVASADFSVRLNAVRAGVTGFFTAPVDVRALLAQLDRHCAGHWVAPYRVLLVHADAAVAAHHALLLQQAGMIVQSLDDAVAVPARCAEFAPDVIAADLHLAGISAVELSRILRQQERCDSIAIALLATQGDAERQLARSGLEAGDFLRTPLAPERFVAELTARARRARAVSAARAAGRNSSAL